MVFKARLELIAELDKRQAGPHVADLGADYGDRLDDAKLRGEVAGLLHRSVAAMNLDNFVVRPRRKSVERFSKLQAHGQRSTPTASPSWAKGLPDCPRSWWTTTKTPNASTC